MALPIIVRAAGAIMPWVSRSRLVRPLVGSRGFLGVNRALSGLGGPPGGGRFLLGGLRLPSQVPLLTSGATSAVANTGRLFALKSFTARITHIARKILKRTPASVLAAGAKIKTFIMSPKFKKVLDGVFLAWMFADILGIFDKKEELSEAEQHKVDDLLLQLIPATFSSQLTPLERTICEYLTFNEDKCDYDTLVERVHSSVIMTSELVDPEISSDAFFVFKIADVISHYQTTYLDQILGSKAFRRHFKESLEKAADLREDKELAEFVDELFDKIDLKEMGDETKKNLILIYILATV